MHYQSTDDTIAFVLPLFKLVLEIHETGLVAPFEREDALFLTNGVLDLDKNGTHPPQLALYRIQALFPAKNFEPLEITNPQHASSPAEYKPGYSCYEIALGHHDPLTDIFCLGLLLASTALDLDLAKPDELLRFIQTRTNPIQHNPRIHPTVSRLITEMTELDRSRRSQDLYDVIGHLEHYRDFDPEKQTDLSQIPGWVDKEPKQREGVILNKLRNRLFDLSRRNRLLYYKPNLRLVNLTVSSVPLVTHYQSIRPELLFTWNGEIAEKITAGKEIVLNKYLRFEDYPWLPTSLDRIRTDARHDVQEYGISELKLVIAFLNWQDLKEVPAEKIQSPLLLLPVSLKKNKKVKEDHYILQFQDNVAEVNPVLAGQLRELYGIRLPQFIDLEEMSLSQFYDLLKTPIEKANQGIRLQYVDKPRIRIIQGEARQTEGNYRRRFPSAPPREAEAPENSKALPENSKATQTPEAPGDPEAPENPAAQPEPKPQTQPAPQEAPQEYFELTQTGEDPHAWDFDICNMVLGNFHYKKMSLVRDYNTVIDRGQPHPSFEALFSEQPRPWSEHLFDGNAPDQWFHVVPADPTQTSAILQSRAGHSYIIQGPPGTGKSQTITNLIADFVARGKSILFVCEKRAALDVVFHRLKQVGLEELCCYIHDSQGDKREFIRNLKTTYEDFITSKNIGPNGQAVSGGSGLDLADLKQQRETLLQGMTRDLTLLRDFHDVAASEETASGMPARELTDKLIGLRQDLVPLNATQEEELPSYAHWQTAQPVVTQLEQLLDQTEPGATFHTHPFSRIKENIFLSASPHQTLETNIRETLKALDETETQLDACNLEPRLLQDQEQIKSLVQFAVLLYPLARTGNLALADPDSPTAKEWEQRQKSYRQQMELYRQTQQKNSHWRKKPEVQDLASALPLATKYEHAFLGRWNGGWKKLKNYIDEQYDFSAHSVRPSYQMLLEGVKGEYSSSEQLEHTRRSLEDHYGFGQNLDTATLSIDLLQQRKGHRDLDYLLRHPDGAALVTALQAVHQPLNTLETALARCLQSVPEHSNFTAIRDELLTIRLNADSLAQWLPTLRTFTGLPEPVKTALRRLPLRMKQTEAAIIRKSLQQFYQQHRNYAATDGADLEKAVAQLDRSYNSLLQINARLIRAFVRQKFLHQLELTNKPVGQITEEQKHTRKNWLEGRKILENEFGKTMRYKSIRELSEKESGQVLKLLKPIWLMSPYSVSDSLPLDDEHFDVVIFDEASQITLEEGVPSLYRSKQTIIVGDEKQMPPTDFFSTGSKDKDPDDLEITGLADSEWLSDDADSLLAQGTRKLDSTLLSWHYRSHYETLISFSNYAFYEGNLLTIPDKTIHHRDASPIRISRPEEAPAYADHLFNRSISFHRLTESVYTRRTNPDEATYIAWLVRQVLSRGGDDSIGIVAFSAEQQRAIETALDTLAGTDPVFSQQLEEAYNHTANDQFVGLIIKNLENIQGDERDIIIISVCYGPDSQKRMVMNFGPINKKGGEKRLNVLFSRARKHMAVVSSIRYDQITNEYNTGAGFLRRFLQYAEFVGAGQMTAARAVLDGLTPEKQNSSSQSLPAIMRSQLKEQLTALGYEVGGPIGQSDFKCSLAVKQNAADDNYTLAILIDDEGHYQNENLVEQYYQRPAILRDFGWKVLPVYAKDWLLEPQQVLDQILKALRPESSATASMRGAGDKFATVASAESATSQKIAGSTPGPYDHLVYHKLVHPDKSIWEAATDNNKLIVRWGLPGARLQIRLRTFPDEATAGKELAKLEEEQKLKGYEQHQEPR